MKGKGLVEILEEAVRGQEMAVMNNAARFADETEAEYQDKIARRLTRVVASRRANDLPGITGLITGHGETEYQGFWLIRRIADDVDNVYIGRI